MKRFAVVISLLVTFLFWKTPIADAQFSEAGVEKLRVAVEAPDFTLKEAGGGKSLLKN